MKIRVLIICVVLWCSIGAISMCTFLVRYSNNGRNITVSDIVMATTFSVGGPLTAIIVFEDDIVIYHNERR